MAEAKKPASSSSKKPAKKRKALAIFKPFRAIGGYFKGSWQELRVVRWPNRRATWSLTLAVILFTAFFSAVILALDYAFQYLFKEILL